MKKIIDDYFRDNYKYINKNAKYAAYRLKRNDLKSDMISNCYIYLVENEIYEDLELVIFYYFMNQWRNKISQIKKEIDYNTYMINEIDLSVVIDNSDEELDDIINREEKINNIEEKISKMATHHKFLFDLIYKENYNTVAKLSKYLNTTRYVVEKMLKNFKNKIIK